MFGTISVPSGISKCPFASIAGRSAPGRPQSPDNLFGVAGVYVTFDGMPMLPREPHDLNTRSFIVAWLAHDMYTAFSELQYANA